MDTFPKEGDAILHRHIWLHVQGTGAGAIDVQGTAGPIHLQGVAC